jgi:transposase-like protein
VRPTETRRAAPTTSPARSSSCREHEISDTLFYAWRDKLLEGGREALAGKDKRQGEKERRQKVRELERALGRKTYELEIAGEALRGWE